MTLPTLTPKSLFTSEELAVKGEVKSSHKVLALFRFALIALPVISLLISVWSWLRFGVDIPVYDDWRQYNANDMGRLDLAYLLTPHNDTLYSFGLLLDSLAFRFLDGNTVAYQLLSLVAVLGGLLVLQWKLLSSCTNDKNVLAISFSFTLLMLQPDTYWGWQNLAYHQAVPLVCILGILALTLREKSASPASLLGVFLLASVSGLTYISGAFSVLALCLTFLTIGYLKRTPYTKNLINVGLSILLPALVTTGAQLWVIVEIQHGTHRADAPMAFPWESDFWLFMLGKVGRSLMLPMSYPRFSLLVTSLAAVLLIALVAIGFFKIIRNLDESKHKPFIIIISLSAIIFVYLLLISAGRTNLRPEEVTSPEEIFIYGFYRFHFFWVTLLWPWVALLCLKTLRTRHATYAFALLTTTLALGIWSAAIASTTIMDNYSFYKSTMKQRTDGIACILEKIQQSNSVICPNIDLGDISKGIKNGRAAEASFSRTLPILPIPLGTDNPPPLFRLSKEISTIKLTNTQKLEGAGTLNLLTQNDPNIIITVPATEDLSHCQTVNVAALMTASESSVAQIFYMTPQHLGYSEAYSSTTSVTASSAPQLLNFTINSSDGFEHEFRFDPVTASQKISIKELEVRCRSTANAN